MTKKQLIDSFTNYPFINTLLGVDDLNVGVANGGKRYRLNYLEVVGLAAIESSQEFYVFGEGTPNEEAFWFRNEPQQSLGINPIPTPVKVPVATPPVSSPMA